MKFWRKHSLVEDVLNLPVDKERQSQPGYLDGYGDGHRDGQWSVSRKRTWWIVLGGVCGSAATLAAFVVAREPAWVDS